MIAVRRGGAPPLQHPRLRSVDARAAPLARRAPDTLPTRPRRPARRRPGRDQLAARASGSQASRVRGEPSRRGDLADPGRERRDERAGLDPARAARRGRSGDPGRAAVSRPLLRAPAPQRRRPGRDRRAPPSCSASPISTCTTAWSPACWASSSDCFANATGSGSPGSRTRPTTSSPSRSPPPPRTGAQRAWRWRCAASRTQPCCRG